MLPDITEESSVIVKKVGGKLIRQHYLGWTSFFLLSFFLPIWALLLVIAISFFNNSFSFVFGRKLGSTRLSEFNPTKTLEGSICSSLLSCIVFSVLSVFVFKSNLFGKGNFHNNEIGFISFVIFLVGAVSILSNWGDCTFSLCKRALGYKNFGRLFGIKVGGFWDRFDSLSSSLFFTSILFWFTLAIVTKKLGLTG
ncbi:hypothetical protein OVS_02990 [Mycoplasma ovis str. Michigan]|uniref:Phosphatidate cytidylyltransferase n=1 Tax=Mycoplasma ovis str. Michigan TaxID=1415773 RepID=A0ABN4BRM6_9MOLU|nr:hypothetical protein OVS_02990 [Mycoplasma ovis str. Michigan]